MKKVFVGMSGGVDSSVAAALLKQATSNNFKKLFGRPSPKGFRGYEVTGIHLRCFNVDGCAAQDAEDARRTAETLGIPFYTLDMEAAYKARVVEYMVAGYRRGETPNPDVMCNREIKFGLFLEKALSMGADFVATGHYIRVERSKIKDRNNDSKTKTAYRLFSGKDSNKDQSYFLWTLTQAQLRHTLFPIGRYTKPEVRALARKFGLPNAEKKDSQGICFLGVVKLEDFLAQYIPPHAGVVLNTTGAVIGTHRGAAYYTIGQRHGLGVALGSPVYVAAKDVRANTLTVAAGEDSALSRRAVTLADVHFIRPVSPRPSQQIFVSARVRYRQPLQEAVFNARTGVLVFTTPVKFVAPGQSAVLYTSAGEVLGGGIIV